MAVEPRPAAARLTPAILLALQAFEAAYRLGSFRAAAETLHLTPSAVSHRIRNLERLVGDSLFVRAHRNALPSAAGRAMAAATGRAFMELGRAIAGMDAPPTRTRLRLAVVPTFGSAWLIPRVADFMAGHPNIELVIENVSRSVDFDNEPFDAAISGGAGEWPGMSAVRLMAIFTTPICTPQTMRKLKLRRAVDLQRATLIHVTTYPLAWRLWFEHAETPEPPPRKTLWVDSFHAAQEAAERGVGVALGLAPLLHEREQLGLLCCPFESRNPTGDYWLVHRTADARSPALRAFRQWLVARTAAEAAANR